MNSEFTNIIINTLREYNPEMIGIFGSYARNESTPDYTDTFGATYTDAFGATIPMHSAPPC